MATPIALAHLHQPYRQVQASIQPIKLQLRGRSAHPLLSLLLSVEEVIRLLSTAELLSVRFHRRLFNTFPCRISSRSSYEKTFEPVKSTMGLMLTSQSHQSSSLQPLGLLPRVSRPLGKFSAQQHPTLSYRHRSDFFLVLDPKLNFSATTAN